MGRHIRELDRILGEAVGVITPSIFYVLYSDREYLREFQNRISEIVSGFEMKKHTPYMIRDGVIKRPTYIPSWLKTGVFYRDRGRCQLCWKDLSGLARPVQDLRLDHIIPLAVGGSNDPTNFQLLCDGCNSSKGKKRMHKKPKFAPYW
jgi:hypothetical protein